jgi:hypothetical protein
MRWAAPTRATGTPQTLLRILTPVYKFRACRDNIPVASQALEVRGGIGYIEEWVTARLVRDAQIGTLWEGTSNINALDVVQRAVGKSGGHKTLTAALKAKYEPSGSLPGQYKGLLGATLDRVERFAEAVAPTASTRSAPASPPARSITPATAALMAWEGRDLGAQGGDARRLLLSRLVIEHRLAPAGSAVARTSRRGSRKRWTSCSATRPCHSRRRPRCCLITWERRHWWPLQ